MPPARTRGLATRSSLPLDGAGFIGVPGTNRGRFRDGEYFDRADDFWAVQSGTVLAAPALRYFSDSPMDRIWNTGIHTAASAAAAAEHESAFSRVGYRLSGMVTATTTGKYDWRSGTLPFGGHCGDVALSHRAGATSLEAAALFDIPRRRGALHSRTPDESESQ